MVKPKSFPPPWSPEQTLLFPPSPAEWLSVNSLGCLLLGLAADLDLDMIHSYSLQMDSQGEMAYDPQMMVVMLL